MSLTRPTFGRLDTNADRRLETRRPVTLRGKLAVGAQFSFDCVIRNISEGGARIELGLAMPQLTDAWLIDLAGAAAWRAAVIWRRDPELGLRFFDRHDLKRPSPTTPGHIRKLWLDAGGK